MSRLQHFVQCPVIIGCAASGAVFVLIRFPFAASGTGLGDGRSKAATRASKARSSLQAATLHSNQSPQPSSSASNRRSSSIDRQTSFPVSANNASIEPVHGTDADAPGPDFLASGCSETVAMGTATGGGTTVAATAVPAPTNPTIRSSPERSSGSRGGIGFAAQGQPEPGDASPPALSHPTDTLSSVATRCQLPLTAKWGNDVVYSSTSDGVSHTSTPAPGRAAVHSGVKAKVIAVAPASTPADPDARRTSDPYANLLE